MGETNDHAPDSEAKRLLDTWDRLSRAHMVAGGGCSCGIGGVVVALADFEQDIVDFVDAEAERLERPDVRHHLETLGRSEDAWSIRHLLSSLSVSERATAADDAVASFILERLGRTLQSFEKLHGSA